MHDERIQRRRRGPRGATLIEFMLAFALLAIVLSVTVGLIVAAIDNGAQGRARAGLARQGSFASALMANEIRMAGLGVPPGGKHIDDAYAGAGVTSFDASVILATDTAVGFLGDYPRPHTQYSTWGILSSRPAGSQSNVMWLTENNGACAPTLSSAFPSCSTATTSVFFPGEKGCAGAAGVNDRTCPWGMKRVEGGDRIQVVSGRGDWTQAGVANPLAMSDRGTERVLSLNLSTSWANVWPNILDDDPPVAVSGQGYVTTIDRIFYVLNGKNLERYQCWGDPDPQNVNWPNLATNSMPSLANLAVTPAGGLKNECIGPEVVLQNIASLDFDYADAAGVSTTTKTSVRRVDWTIKLRRTVQKKVIEQDIVGTAGLRN